MAPVNVVQMPILTDLHESHGDEQSMAMAGGRVSYFQVLLVRLSPELHVPALLAEHPPGEAQQADAGGCSVETTL
jgi:hypothetical protein